MRIFGFEISRTKQANNLQQVGNYGNWWWPIVREPFTGAWQRNQEISTDTILAYSAVYSCITLIASDISKMRIRLVQQDSNGIWSETTAPAFSPVLRKPNRYQNRIKFVEQWVQTKLIHGNAYILKERDARGIVVRLYVLDPTRTKALVAPDGSVFYELRADLLSGIGDETIIVPAREIIHDPMSPMRHPLYGISPLSACGLAAVQGLNIQSNSSQFFANGSHPGGILTAPGAINTETAERLKAHWEANYTGANVGKVAVLGDGLKYEKMSVNAVDAQLIEQLKWTAETVCSAFHVPPYMIGVAPAPSYNNIEALNQQYYSQCLQGLIEQIELSLDEGLGLTEVEGKTYGTEFDLRDLLRMDTATKVKAAADAISAGFLAPNEARADFDLPPVEGGNTPYLQQQNFSLAALDKRDQGDPFAPPPAPQLPPPPEDEDVEAEVDEGRRTFLSALTQDLSDARYG